MSPTIAAVLRGGGATARWRTDSVGRHSPRSTGLTRSRSSRGRHCSQLALIARFGIALKAGGTALKKCCFGDYRFSEDLDFTLTVATSWEDLERGLTAAFKETYQRSGVDIRLDHMDRQTHANSHTVSLAYEGPLPHGPGKSVKTDITIRERIVLPLKERPILRGYEEYRDLPPDARLRVYSLEEVAVEQTVALLDRARNEPRDLYDLWFLTANGHVRLSDLLDPLAQKLEFRGVTLAQVS